MRFLMIAALAVLSALCAANTDSLAAPGQSSPNKNSLVPAQIGEDWAVWDKSSCKFNIIPRSERPKSWVATFRKAPAGTSIAFGAENEQGSFAELLTASVQKAITQSGATYLFTNYNEPDTSQPIIGAQGIAEQKPSIVISWNVLPAVIPAVNAIYGKQCIPVIQISDTAPNTVEFGPSNEVAGDLGGAYISKLIRKKHWNPKQITVLEPEIPSQGAVNKRVTNCAKTIKQNIPEVTVQELDLGTDNATGLTATTDWLTSHPASGSSTYVVGCVVADVWAYASVTNAIVSAGRGNNALFFGQGAALDGIKAIEQGGPFVGTSWFDLGQYGDYLVPLALDILAGKPVPVTVHQRLLVVDKSNAPKFYKGQ